MTFAKSPQGSCSILSRLREATGELHRRIDERLGLIDRLTDVAFRSDYRSRFSALLSPAFTTLAPHLADLPDLDFNARKQKRLAGLSESTGREPGCPQPTTLAEALGMLYVLEGSSLGGQVIVRSLAKQGIDDETLRFVDPYREEVSGRWRGFLAVLERQVTTERDIDEACNGAVSMFRHAELVLCEGNA